MKIVYYEYLIETGTFYRVFKNILLILTFNWKKFVHIMTWFFLPQCRSFSEVDRYEQEVIIFMSYFPLNKISTEVPQYGVGGLKDGTFYHFQALIWKIGCHCKIVVLKNILCKYALNLSLSTTETNETIFMIFFSVTTNWFHRLEFIGLQML